MLHITMFAVFYVLISIVVPHRYDSFQIIAMSASQVLFEEMDIFIHTEADELSSGRTSDGCSQEAE